MDFDLNLVIRTRIEFERRAIDPGAAEVQPWFADLKTCAELGVPMNVPWRELPEAARETVLRGNNQRYRLRGRVWILCADGAQEVQAACACDAEQVSRYAECPDCRGQRYALKRGQCELRARTFARRRH